jgi:hypothetical protein
VKSLRRNPDDGVRLAVDGQDLTDDRGVTIPPRIREPGERSGVALPIPCLLDAAERASRRDARLFGRHAAALEVVREQREMRRDLPRQVGFRTVRTNHIQQPEEEMPQSSHCYDSFKSNLSTRLARRRHRAVCTPSARVPAFVMA